MRHDVDMELQGYMLKVQWDGQTLRARGTTKASRMALMGREHDDGDLVLTREQITEARYKKAGLMTNGRLVLRDWSGRKYQLHFRRKQRDGFDALARELGAA